MTANSRPLHIKYIDAAFLILLAAGLCFLIWRAPLGFADSDEAFYLTIPYRLAMGDALIADEWHVSQLAGFLLLPAMKLYLLFSGGTEGIILFFRYLCVGSQALAAVYIYLRLRKEAPLGGLFAALAFFLYVPFNISALSYNSMGLIFMSCVCVTLATVKAAHLKRDLLLSGLLFAGAVLCCPHLVILYVVYCAAMLLRVIRRKRLGEAPEEGIFGFRSWLLFSVGAFVLALLFAIFLLARAELRSLVNSVLVILNDPEHPRTPFFTNIYAYFESIFGIHKFAPFALSGCAALLIIIFFDKSGRGERRALYIAISAVLCALYFAPFLIDGLAPLYYAPGITVPPLVNYLMFPLNILGLFAYLLSPQKKRRFFTAVYIPGLIYGFCIHLSSNQRLFNIASAATVSLLASLIFIFDLISLLCTEGRREKAAAMLLVCFCVMQLACQIFFRARFAFEEQVLPKDLTHTIAYGPEKGVRTTEDKAKELYYDVYEATQSIREKKSGTVLYYSERTWLYLADSKHSATYSAWLSFADPDHSLNRLLYYWLVNPEKQADYVFVSSDFDRAEEYACKLNPRGLPITKSPCGYIIAQ